MCLYDRKNEKKKKWIDFRRIFYLSQTICKEQHRIFVSSENSNGRMQCLRFHIVLLAIVISFSLTQYCLEAITSLPNRKQENSNKISWFYSKYVLKNYRNYRWKSNNKKFKRREWTEKKSLDVHDSHITTRIPTLFFLLYKFDFNGTS